jgi:hypothetical protein
VLGFPPLSSFTNFAGGFSDLNDGRCIRTPRLALQSTNQTRKQKMTYIDNGRVTRDSRLLTTRWTSYFSWKRFLIIVIPTMILLVTNPVNEEYINTFNASITRDGSSSSFSQKTFNFGREKFVFGRRITNYAIFSLEESFDSMKVYALRHSWTCSFTNFEIGSFCDALCKYLQSLCILDKSNETYKCLLLGRTYFKSVKPMSSKTIAMGTS